MTSFQALTPSQSNLQWRLDTIWWYMVVHMSTVHSASRACTKTVQTPSKSTNRQSPTSGYTTTTTTTTKPGGASNVQTGELRVTQQNAASSPTPHYHSTCGTCQGVAHQDVTGLLAHRTDRCMPDLHQHMHTLRAAHPQSHHHYRHTVRRSH